ncbi:hypothetical protein ACE6ED_19505 [Paenibacillus sp. CN-4]|uniref:hypothetical protein n=1 Tax=Paenibacillus nanchangensis TaxID=3348343 RepID=UPI00397E8DDE
MMLRVRIHAAGTPGCRLPLSGSDEQEASSRQQKTAEDSSKQPGPDAPDSAICLVDR